MIRTISDRIQMRLQKLGLSERQAALNAGMSADGVRNMRRNPKITPRADNLARLAEVLGTTPEWLLTGKDPHGLADGGASRVPVVGYVGAGAEVYAIDDVAMGGSLVEDGVELPFFGVSGAVCVIVRGDSMEPAYHDGDMLIYDDRRDGDYGDLINRECVVQLADGRTYVKILLRGSQPGLWTLISHNASPISDVPIAWAARVKWVQKR
jgi:SOS-response transcriptional repressor LexA